MLEECVLIYYYLIPQLFECVAWCVNGCIDPYNYCQHFGNSFVCIHRKHIFLFIIPIAVKNSSTSTCTKDSLVDGRHLGSYRYHRNNDWWVAVNFLICSWGQRVIDCNEKLVWAWYVLIIVIEEHVHVTSEFRSELSQYEHVFTAFTFSVTTCNGTIVQYEVEKCWIWCNAHVWDSAESECQVCPGTYRLQVTWRYKDVSYLEILI